MTTQNTIKCNHFLCIGKSWWEKRDAVALVSFAGSERVRAMQTYCCPRCLEAYSPLIVKNPSDYSVTGV